MKIIETRTAPNPRRVRIFLAEKGVQVTYEQRDLMAGELKSDDFSALNPFQRVPVLILDDGTVISESVAICRYFEEMEPDPPLFGVGPVGRAQVEMWQRRAELGLWFNVAQAFRHLHPKMAHLEVPQVPDWGEANKGKASEMLEFFDRRLRSSRFIAGAGYTIADITALVAIDYLKPARIAMPAGLDGLARWYQEVFARPSAAA
ncbi:MAG: glutathione S-transferase [Hyphomicrobiaceae bacterium]|nr:glutathione S-transferase [Hyphomicrobiaceae bacterium]